MYDVVVHGNDGHYETMNQIVELYLKGNKNPTAIAKQIGIPRKDVLLYIEQWQELAQNRDVSFGDLIALHTFVIVVWHTITLAHIQMVWYSSEILFQLRLDTLRCRLVSKLA